MGGAGATSSARRRRGQIGPEDYSEDTFRETRVRCVSNALRFLLSQQAIEEGDRYTAAGCAACFRWASVLVSGPSLDDGSRRCPPRVVERAFLGQR